MVTGIVFFSKISFFFLRFVISSHLKNEVLFKKRNETCLSSTIFNYISVLTGYLLLSLNTENRPFYIVHYVVLINRQLSTVLPNDETLPLYF